MTIALNPKQKEYSRINRYARLGARGLASVRKKRNADSLGKTLDLVKRDDEHSYNAVVRDLQSRYDRKDSARISHSPGFAFARDLEHVYGEVLRDDYPDNNALTLFPIDRSVAPGKRTHTVRRLQESGRAEVHRGKAQDIPAVTLASVEETFNVLHYITGVEWDYFEKLSAQSAGFNLLGEHMTTARDVLLEFANTKTWYGDPINDLYGVLNYPYLNKMVMSGVFRLGGDAPAMLQSFLKLINEPGQITKGIASLKINKVLVSIRMMDILEGTYFEGVQAESVLDRIKRKGIDVEAVWEMQEAGPGGTDAVFAFRSGDKRSVANVIPMGFTSLPAQNDGFDYKIPCFMSHGGIIMRKPLMNILGYATVED